MILLVISTMYLSVIHTAHAQTPVSFSGKGMIDKSSTFHGVVIWTIFHGDKGTIILQSPVGRGLLHLSLSPSIACNSSASICLFSNVTDTQNVEAFKVGDTTRFAIDTTNKQGTISQLSGLLAGFDVTVNFSKIWNKTATPETKNPNTGLANPASVYCINHGGLEITRTDNTGAQQGFCKFPNGSVCDEWEYFRGECKPAS
jgi:putative hemolysin